MSVFGDHHFSTDIYPLYNFIISVFWNFIAVVVFGAMDKKDSKDAQKAGIDIG